MWDGDRGDKSWYYWSAVGAVELRGTMTSSGIHRGCNPGISLLGQSPLVAGSLCSPSTSQIFGVSSPWQPHPGWPPLDGGEGPRSVWDISDVKH